MSLKKQVVFVWNEVTGYMSACWQELQHRAEVSLSVVSHPSSLFNESLVKPLHDCVILSREDYSAVRRSVVERNPQVLVLCGWGSREMRMLAAESSLSAAAKVITFDSQWFGTLRQRLGVYLLRPHMRKFSAAMIASQRGYEYARRLGFDDSKIVKGMYSIDFNSFARATKVRADPWPKAFVFVGRYAPEKGIRLLVDGYRQYRSSVPDPWPLVCLGAGPLKPFLAECPGVIDKGFVEPNAIPQVLAECGTFILPSLYEPWGAVVAEAAAAGLPLLCSTACGASDDLVRHGDNGYLFARNDQVQIEQALVWAHRNYKSLPACGLKSQELATRYSARSWADRWETLIQELVTQP